MAVFSLYAYQWSLCYAHKNFWCFLVCFPLNLWKATHHLIQKQKKRIFQKLLLNLFHHLTALLLMLFYTDQGGLTLSVPLGWCQTPQWATHRGTSQQLPSRAALSNGEQCPNMHESTEKHVTAIRFWKVWMTTLPIHLPHLCETRAVKQGWLVRPHWQDKCMPLKKPRSYWRQKAMDWVPCHTQKADICFTANAKRNSLSQA